MPSESKQRSSRTQEVDNIPLKPHLLARDTSHYLRVVAEVVGLGLLLSHGDRLDPQEEAVHRADVGAEDLHEEKTCDRGPGQPFEGTEDRPQQSGAAPAAAPVASPTSPAGTESGSKEGSGKEISTDPSDGRGSRRVPQERTSGRVTRKD